MSDTNDLFVRASKEAFRYPSVKGELTTEDLWNMPLLAKYNNPAAGPAFDLDSVARTINAELKALGEESFVETENPKRSTAAAKLEVVKHVIATMQAEAKAKVATEEKAARARKIREVLANKKDQALSQASEEELLKMLAELETKAA